MRLEQNSYCLNTFCPNRLPRPGPLPERATSATHNWCVWVASSLSPNQVRRRQKRNPPCCSSDPPVPSQPGSISLLPELSYSHLLGDVGVVRSPLGGWGPAEKGVLLCLRTCKARRFAGREPPGGRRSCAATRGHSPVCRAPGHTVMSGRNPSRACTPCSFSSLFHLPVFKIRTLGLKGKRSIFHQIGHFYLFPNPEIRKSSQNGMLSLISQKLTSLPCLLVSGGKYI